MNYVQALGYLNSFINYEKNLHQVSPKAFSLERVERLLSAFDDPQKALRVIHVAGTKGKGSTCAFVGSILKHAGYRTGLYTSPHINDVRERIRVSDLKRSSPARHDDIYQDMISEEEFSSLIARCKATIDGVEHEPDIGKFTFFEVLTALAFVYFKEKKTDLVVLETGLGGRLDATNAAPSLIAAVTPISLEHTHLLGDTLELITNEKKAIIKSRDQRVVLAAQEKVVMDLLIKRTAEFGVKPVIVGSDFVYKPVSRQDDVQIFNIESVHQNYNGLQIPLLGEHQLVNAATGLAIIEQLKEAGYPVSAEAVYDGLKNTFWPLRFERISADKNIILDGAHTEASSKALAEAVLNSFPGKHVTMILGFTMGKDINGMCRQFNRIAGRVIATQSRHPRALSPSEELIRTGFPNKPYLLTQTVEEALDLAKKDLKPDGILLICGSLYLVSEARKLCIN